MMSKAALAVASVAALFVGTSAASASVDGVCVYTGHANVFASPVIWVGGGGDFGFDSQLGACAGVANGTAATEQWAPGALHAAGTYASLVCGTASPSGPAAGTATLTANPIGGTGTFSIPFVAGQGVTTGSFTDTNGDSGPLVGFVEIFPNPPVVNTLVTGGAPNSQPGLPPNGTCVDNYGVAGAFAVVG